MQIDMSIGFWYLLIIVALLLDFFFCEPSSVFHPVVIMGKGISFFEKVFNRGKFRKIKGLFMWLVMILLTVTVLLILQRIALACHFFLYVIINGFLLFTAISGKCMDNEAKKVTEALAADQLALARKQVGMLVGRDTEQLGKGGLIRAMVETISENTVDGVLAPMFYMFIGCFTFRINPILNPVVLALGYKVINTMDSMVGYKQEPYTDFGFFPAKLDDLFNWLIARLGALMMLVGGFVLGYNIKDGFDVFKADRLAHNSPNSAHPEAVVAGLLGIQLGGTNTYFGQKVEKPTIGIQRRQLVHENIGESVSIMYSSECVFACIMTIIILVAYILY